MVIIDDKILSVFAPCGDCANYLSDHKCKAFLEGIPKPILDGENQHKDPYPGDNGIQFELSR